MVVNLTDKTDYVSSYRVFEKVSQNRKHCISNLFNTASYSTSLLKPKICFRWVSREESVKPVKR